MLHAIAENYNNDTRRLELQVIAEFIVYDCQVTFGKLRALSLTSPGQFSPLLWLLQRAAAILPMWKSSAQHMPL